MAMCAAERSGPKLQNEWSFVKIGLELASEMSKM